MKKLLAGAAALAAAILTLPAGATAQTDAEITLLHGIPEVAVDVLIDGEVVIPDFQPGTIQDLSAFAGQTLTDVEILLAGTVEMVIGPIAEFTVPSTGSYTLVAHLDAEGTPLLTPFENDSAPIADGNGRLTVRHTAAAPAVDLVIGEARPIINAVNGSSAHLDIPAGEISGAQIAPTGGDAIFDVPTVELGAGTNLIVYAVGSLDDDNFTIYTQERTVGIDGDNAEATEDDNAESGGTDDPAATGDDDGEEEAEATEDADEAEADATDGTPAPTAVNTGDELGATSNALVLFAAAAGMFAVGGGAMAMRRKTVRR